MEKDRSRRYETANGLARDIERHLHDEAVEACPPSAGYRFRKFVRRHRAAMTSGAMFALLLMGAVLASTWMAVQARRAAQAEAEARRMAEEARHRAEEAQKEAKRSEVDAKAVLEFFQQKLLNAGRPQRQKGTLGKQPDAAHGGDSNSNRSPKSDKPKP